MSESFPSASDPLAAATQLVKNGCLDEAQEVLTRHLMQNPSSEQGWLLMSFVLSDAAQQKDCLERVLQINANNTVAQSRLAHILGKRTEDLFPGEEKPPSPPYPKAESTPESRPVPAIASKPPSSGADVERSHPIALPTASAGVLKPPPLRKRKPARSGKWFWIITVILIIVILGIVGTILYIGLIGPAISRFSATSTPTTQAVIVPTLPPIWTNTLTPTITLTMIFTPTPTVTLTLASTATQTKSKTATKKL